MAAAAESSPDISIPGVSNVQYAIAGGCIFMALALLVDVRPFTPKAAPSNLCQQMVRPDAVLSRDHLTQILAISERTARSAVQQVMAEPYCRLSPVSIRAGVLAEREAYPLGFDPDTWLVMLYEGEEYAGFDFSFQR
ncbi:MAG: hypothetical protein F6K30_27370 [Cyanothece sp. SIO2G6]|nr:hypothetical protein [Cyanothece sp. SIO2G6]